MALKGSLAQDISGQAKDILGTENLDPSTNLLEGEKTRHGLKGSTAAYVPQTETVTQGEVPSSYERILGEGNYHPDFGYQYNQELLHSKQSATGVLANTLLRFGAEVISTAGQTMAYDSDLNMGAQLSIDTEREFGNVASRMFENLRDKAQKIAPIYADPYKEGKFDPGSLSWWGENAVSVGSSIGMVLPAALMSGITGGLGMAAGLNAEMVGSNAFKGITTALWSRHAENLMEASGVYKQAFDEAKRKGMSDKDAKNVASLGASNTYKKQWTLLLQDIPQYILLNKLGAFGKGGAAAEKAAIDELAPSVQKYLGYGSLNTAAKRVGAVAKDMAGEAGEEIYQFIVNEQSNLMARNAADPNHNVKHSMIDVVKANYDNGDMWTAGFWGAAGAGAMQATMHGINRNLQEAVNKAQLETVTAFGPMLKQAYTEYDAALKDNDPRLAEQAAPAFIVSLAMKAKKTGTVAALKNIMKQMKDAPEGTSFDQYGVDQKTQGRLKQDPAFYEQVEKGIDRVGELYDRYLKENQSNNKISTDEKEPKAQAMANTQFLLDSTKEHVKKLEMAVNTAWPKIEGVLDLSESGREAERLKQTKLSKERSLAAFQKRQETTADTASPSEKKQIELAVAQLNSEIAQLDNLIDEEVGNKEKGVKGKRTAVETKADKKIVLPQDQVDEYVKQSKRLNAANASIAQLTEVMDELRSSAPLGETIKKQVENELGVKPDKIDQDNSIQLDAKVEYEDPDTKEVVKGKIVGIEEADETNENDVTSFVVETENGETVIKPETDLHKTGDETSDSEGDTFDSLSEEDELLLGRPVQVEDEEAEKQAMLNMNKLSYSQWDPVSKQYINRNPELAKVLSSKETSFAGAQAFYSIDVNEKSTKEMLTALITSGVYSKGTFKIVVTDRQRGILKKLVNGNKLLKEEISTLLDESNDNSFSSFVDGIPVSVELNLNSTSYKGGMYLHGSKFVPDSSVPVREKTKGATQADRNKNVNDYKKTQYVKNRKIRRDLLSILLQGGKVITNGLDRSKGNPNSASKTIKPTERNHNLETALGIEADKIKLAITKSNDLTPELTTLYLDKNSPIKGTSKTMQGKGNIYAYLAGEGLNNEAGIIKLNKASFEKEFASILLDAFFLVGQAKISKRSKTKTGKKTSFHSHAVRFSEEVLKRHGAKITGITAGELIDLFLVNGEKITEPLNPRFQKRYGKDPAFSKLMGDKRLYLYIKGKDVVLVYGQDKSGKPNLINLNQHGLPSDVADLTTKREHFINWLVENKRIATLLYDPSLGNSKLNLNGDFLDDRTIHVEFKTKDSTGKSSNRIYHRDKGQTYSSFLIKNNMVLTDVSRENGSLFRDPVVNLNLINNRGGLNVTSKVKPLPVEEKAVISGKTIVNEDLENKQDAAFSDTKVEKEEQKPAIKKKDTAYKNRFIDKKTRSSYDADTLELNQDQWTKDTLIPNISTALEEMIEQGLTIDQVKKNVVDSFVKSNVTFGTGAKRDTAILGYIEDRFAGKTNRTLKEEFDAATTPATDKTSSTATEATGIPIEVTVNNTEIEPDNQEVPPPSMDDLNGAANNEPPFAREESITPYESYTKELRQKEIDWAFDTIGISKEEWQLKQRITDLLYKGKRNFALYSHSAILLFEAAELGTIYHEAFHRVSLGYLTPDERKSFYRTARLAYKLDKDSTDKQVEEVLAEKFRSFVLSDNKQQSPGLVQKFFDWIMKGIKALFYGKRRLSESEINTLFKQIRNGKFRNSAVLEVNKDSLGDELYARAIIKGIEFDTLNNRKDFRTITNSLAKTLLIKSGAEDLNNVESIDFLKLIERLEKLRDGYKANAEYKGNSKEVKEQARHLYEMYDELLGTKDELGRYDTFQQVIKPAIDSYFLSIGIKQIGVGDETDYLGVDTEDPESVSKLGDYYVGAAYELNKRDTALPAIKFLIATLNADSEIIEDKETGGLKRVPRVNPVTMLYEPVDFKQVWSKAFHALHHLDSIEEMINELKYIANHDNYSPFAELAGKLEKESTNTREQFFRTLSCAEYDFINIGFTNNNGNYKLTLNRSSEQSAINDNIRNWSDSFFNSDDIVETVPQYNAKKDKDGKLILNKKNEPIADLKGEKSYIRIFKKSFFKEEEKKFADLSQDVSDVVNSNTKNYEGKLVKLLPRVVDLLSDFGIMVDENSIRKVISDIQGETIDNDVDRLYNWVENQLVTLFTSDAAKAAEDNGRAIRSEHSFFKIGAVKDIARAYIDTHPELKSDIQVGPGDGDTKRQHKRNTFAEDSHATSVVNRIKNTEGYVEERVTNAWTRRSKILRSMIPYDLADEQQIAAAKEARDKFKLVTYSYLRETGTEDKGRGYLNMTEREDYVVRFHLLMTEGLLPFPIMAQRKTYFFMEGVERFKNSVVGYDPKTRNLQFSDEVTNYFWDAYRDENERATAAIALINKFKKAKGEEKENLRKQLVVNYHFTGAYNTEDANAVKLIRFRGFDMIDTFNDTTKKAFVKKIIGTLNKRITQELKYANNLGVIAFDTDTNGYAPGIVNQSSIDTYSSERDEDVDFGVRATIGEYTLNYIMSIIESERVFMGDPALFIKNKNSGEVVEDLYKRYYGMGSTGQPYAEMINEDPEETSVTYNAATIRTQKFKSLYYDSLVKLHTRLWLEHFNEKDPTNPKNLENAKELAESNLKGYKKVDATDGGAVISPSMYKSMLKRSGAFTKKVQYAFELLMSNRKLSTEEEIKALNIVLNPQKTVYFGMHSENGIDKTVYDKMSMSVIFPRLVRGTHLEQVFDRMEKTGKYANNKSLQKIQVLNYDSAIKIGQTVSHDLYVNKETRDELADLTDIVTENRYWKNLRQQMTTDAHSVASKQMVGTQVFKISSSNIIVDKPYGKFATGRDLLNSLTKSRMAVSETGKHHVESALGIRNGVVSNRSLIEMLHRDAISAKKTDDFRSALKLDPDGRMYLELDAFPDRSWVYSRLMNLVTSNTIDLKLPGSQLIQVSDYGYSSTGLQTAEKEFKSELKFYTENENGTRLINMECRVPIRVFKKLIPNYDKLTHEERVKALPKNMQIMGYRIPTQGQNSVVNMTVVDYLPDQAGEVIHLPLEFTTLTGSDYDIDKLFTMMKNYRMENGVLKEVTFNEDSTPEGIDVRYDSKLQELYKIYRRDHTVFDTDIREVLKDSKNEVLDNLKVASAQDEIIRRNLEESIEVTKKALEKATDEISKRYLEDQILSEQTRIDEINDANFSEQFSSEKWSKQKSIILKALRSANKIGTVEEFGKLSVEEQNTSEANENRMFDIFQTVISDLKHARNTTLPLGTLTDELKKKRDDYTEARSGGKIVPLEALESETPMYQSNTKFKFMTSTKGIGVYALANANHSLTQQANVRLRTKFNYGKDVNLKDSSIPLDRIEGNDLKYITDWLSAMLDAHVDAIKDNYIAELNINSATYSVTSLLLRLGFGVSTFDLMAQPIIVDLAKAFYNLGGGRHAISEDAEYEDGTTVQKAYIRVKKQLLASLNRSIEDAEDLNVDLVKEKIYIPLNKLMEDKVMLLDGLNPSKNTTQDHKIRQLNFLEHFMKMSIDAEKVNSLVLNTRVDTKSFGSNPVEFRHFMNKLIALEQEDVPKDKRDFINLDRFINSRGEYVENGTMLAPLLNNSIFYLEKIFNDKSIVGSTGFNRMFWNITTSIPDSEKFRMSTINSMTGDLFSAIVSKFFSDPRFGIAMSKNRLTTLYTSNTNSIFSTLMKVKSRKFKYYEELKDNKALNMLQIDSKPLTSVENHITTPFQAASDSWDNDDYIADFKALIEHEDATVRKLGRQLYLYAFYSTGFKHKRYDYLSYMPTSVNKEINMVNSETKEETPVSFNNFIRYMLEELNDPASIVEFYTGIKKDFFENNWYNYRYVPRIGSNVTYTFSRDESGNINYTAMQFGRLSKYALGTNEDGDIVYPSYVTLDGGADIAQYQIPRSQEELEEASDMETAITGAPSTEESDIIGGNTALFKFVGISKVIDEETKKPQDLAIYIPINKKGALSYGMTTTEMGIESKESFVKYNNLIKQKPYGERIKVINNEIDNFKEIPFDKQQVINRIVRTVNQEIDAGYADEMRALMDAQLEEDTQNRLANKKVAAPDEEVPGSIIDVNIKEQFKKTSEDDTKGKEVEDIC